MELAARIELATSSLLVKRSATELSEPSTIAFGGNRTPANCLEGSYDTISPRTRPIKKRQASKKCLAQEYESCALPTELSSHQNDDLRREGIDPTTSG